MPFANHDRDQVEEEREREQHEHRPVERRPRGVDVGRLRGERIHVVAEVHELIAQIRRQVREEVGRATEHDGCDLASATADREDDACEDASARVGQDHLIDRLKACRA